MPMRPRKEIRHERYGKRLAGTGERHPCRRRGVARTPPARPLERCGSGRLEAWLAASMHHSTAYWRVADAWNRADRLRVLGAPMRATAAPQRKATPWILRAVAA